MASGLRNRFPTKRLRLFFAMLMDSSQTTVLRKPRHRSATRALKSGTGVQFTLGL